jgi:tRNA1(Val) A37 N6-methylase TrmN6
MTMTELTCDEFLGGKLRLWQPKVGYRAGVDPLLLAASLPVQSGQTVLDIGCGIGTAGFAVMAREPGVAVTGIEVQPFYAELARRNVVETGFEMEVVQADFSSRPLQLRERAFDHVIANPPYFDRKASIAGPDGGRERAMGEDTPLAAWVAYAAKRVKPKGYVTFIHRVERLPELLAAMTETLGSIQVLPLTPRIGRESQLFLVRGRKGGRAAFRLHAGLLVHEGTDHAGDRENYTPLFRQVLKDGAALPFPA